MTGRLDRIVISPYDAAWPEAFEKERERIELVLGPWLARPIEHIGSTAIPGMPAKSIIDMLAVVRDIDELEPAVAPLEALAWVGAPEPGDGDHRRRSFCSPTVALRTHHLHVVEEASPGWRGSLAFRDYLRAHPGLANAYAALKQELAAAHGGDPDQRDDYRNGKAAFIAEVTALALDRPPIARVRDATLDDAPGIADVHVAGWRSAYRGLFPAQYLDSLTAEQRLPRWRQWLQDGPPQNQTFVVVIDDRVRGFASLCPGPELGAIYLDADLWGRGLGRELLRAVVDRARSAGHADLTLWVHPENNRARRFYERAGWTDDGVDRVVSVWGLEAPERRYRFRL